MPCVHDTEKKIPQSLRLEHFRFLHLLVADGRTDAKGTLAADLGRKVEENRDRACVLI